MGLGFSVPVPAMAGFSETTGGTGVAGTTGTGCGAATGAGAVGTAKGSAGMAGGGPDIVGTVSVPPGLVSGTWINCAWAGSSLPNGMNLQPVRPNNRLNATPKDNTGDAVMFFMVTSSTANAMPVMLSVKRTGPLH